jgi:hypothetical protein
MVFADGTTAVQRCINRDRGISVILTLLVSPCMRMLFVDERQGTMSRRGGRAIDREWAWERTDIVVQGPNWACLNVGKLCTPSGICRMHRLGLSHATCTQATALRMLELAFGKDREITLPQRPQWTKQDSTNLWDAVGTGNRHSVVAMLPLVRPTRRCPGHYG